VIVALALESLHGRIGDVDSHEQIPVSRYAEVFGERGQRFLDSSLFKALGAHLVEGAGEDAAMMDFATDAPGITELTTITPETVWSTRGNAAPSAGNMDLRVPVLDVMGIRRALVFPFMGLLAFIPAHGGEYLWCPRVSSEDMKAAQEALDAYNEWAGQLTRKHPDRLRVVGLLASGAPGLTPKQLIEKAEEVISTGVRAVMITAGMPPAGLPPGHPDLDPFYATFTQADVAMVFHPPSEIGFYAGNAWTLWGEESVTLALHAAQENFLASMIMGGVLERHPKLRVGFIESGASWIGPLAELLDRGGMTSRPRPKYLSMKPSEYINRQVRVSALLDEPVELWLERHPMIQNSYCYASDFPHPEGKAWSLQEFYPRIAKLGDDVVEKFFCTNSQLLLP
jgi:predicted TIM-barrel fold metal-dependent hydrolase